MNPHSPPISIEVPQNPRTASAGGVGAREVGNDGASRSRRRPWLVLLLIPLTLLLMPFAGVIAEWGAKKGIVKR